MIASLAEGDTLNYAHALMFPICRDFLLMFYCLLMSVYAFWLEIEDSISPDRDFDST